jgi:hypothetical protein
MQNLTILTEKIGLCFKAFKQERNKLVKVDLDNPLWFDHKAVEIDSLLTLSKQLKQLESRKDCLVIRGQLIAGRPSQSIRRTLKASADEEPNFEHCSQQWCLFDIDKPPLPEHLSDYQNNKTEIVDFAVSHLPEQFRNVQCWYQFSSNMGIKQGKVRLHLWYWLSRPCSDAEMKGWLQESPVDLALFNPVQMHYTANPVFLDGALDPFPDRSGMYEPSGIMEVAVPELIPSVVVKKVTSKTNKFGQLDGQEILRDEDTGLIIDGRERFLLTCSNQAMRQLVKGSRVKKLVVNLDELADLTWEYFTDDADVADGKYSRDSAVFEAKRRMQELEDGVFDFSGKSSNVILQAVPEPYFKLIPVSADEGIKQLNDELDDFFENLQEGPKKVLRITMGSGKTFQAIAKLKEFLEKRSLQNIEIYVPRHDLAQEYVDLLTGVNAQVVHVRPRTGGADGKLPVLCQRVDYVKSLEQQGVGVFRNACRSAEGDRCEFYESCDYIAQFIDPDFESDRSNVVRIFVHNYLALRRNPLQDNPSLVIIDESFFSAMVEVHDLSSKEVREQLRSDRHPELGDKFVKSLVSGEPLLETLRGLNVRLGHLDEIDLNVAGTGFDGVRSTALTGRSRGNTQGISALIRQLKSELRQREVTHPQSIFLHADRDGNDVVRVCSRSDLQFDTATPVLMLDATADAKLIDCFFDQDIDLKRIDIKQNAIITQVYDRTGSNTFWQEASAPIEQLITVLNTWAEFGEKPLCIGNKSLIERLQDHPNISPHVVLMNFVGLRGSNAAEECSVVFITGRNEPPPIEVDHKSRALFWDDDIPLQHDEFGNNQNLPLELRGFLTSERFEGGTQGVETRAFSDSRIEAVHQQMREAESIQAIARLRLVHNKQRKRVFILSNVPLEVPIDQLVKFDDLMPDRLEYEFLKAGNIPLTPLGLIKLRPDLAKNDNQAKMLLRNSIIRNASRLKGIHSLQRKGLIIVEFKAENNGRTRTHQHLFMMDEEAKTVLEGDNSLKMAVSKVPMDDWTALLENGWGAIEGTHFFYA